VKPIQNDAAFAMAIALLGVVESALQPEERCDAFAEFYQACRAGLDVYEAAISGMHQRLLKPSRN
jgi:hypothetical protein